MSDIIDIVLAGDVVIEVEPDEIVLQVTDAGAAGAAGLTGSSSPIVVSMSRYGALFDGIEAQLIVPRSGSLTTGIGRVTMWPTSGEMTMTYAVNGVDKIVAQWHSGELSATIIGLPQNIVFGDTITATLVGSSGASSYTVLLSGTPT